MVRLDPSNIPDDMHVMTNNVSGYMPSSKSTNSVSTDYYSGLNYRLADLRKRNGLVEESKYVGRRSYMRDE